MGFFSSLWDGVKDVTSSALGSFGLDVLGNSANSAIDYDYSRKLQHDNQDFQREALRNQIQWRTQDLKDAGLNPMLSTGYQGNVSVGGTVSHGRSNIDPLQALSTAKSLQVMESQKKRNDAEASLLSANAQTAKSNAYINGLVEEVFKGNKDLAIWKALENSLPSGLYQLLASTLGYGLSNKPKTRRPIQRGKAGKALESMNLEMDN